MNKDIRVKKHLRVRRTIIGTDDCPRLSVFKSNKRIFAQLINDVAGKTLVTAGDFGTAGTKLERAYEVGKKIATLAAKKKIAKVVFDRGGFLYHGRIAKLAQGAREGGLKF